MNIFFDKWFKVLMMKNWQLIAIGSLLFTHYSVANDQLSTYITSATPAFATLIVKNNRVVFKGVQGCAILSAGRCQQLANLHTAFPIASVTKHFTAVAILMLEEEGKLSTEDYVSKYIPDLPPQFRGIKIKHLIFHISGIPDYVGDPSFDLKQMLKDGKQFNESVAYSVVLKSKLQPYSKVFVYSNSGYLLLTKIIENVSGESYAEFVQQRIFDRFAMHDAFVMSTIWQHKNYTQAYNPWPLYTPTNWMQVFIPTGDGGVFMSINDFEQWVYALNHNQVFAKKATMKKFLSIGKYDNGKEVADLRRPSIKYGYGLFHSEEYYNGNMYDIVFHEGDINGNVAYIGNLHNKSENIWVVYLDNASSSPDSFDILDQAKIKY